MASLLAAGSFFPSVASSWPSTSSSSDVRTPEEGEKKNSDIYSTLDRTIDQLRINGSCLVVCPPVRTRRRADADAAAAAAATAPAPAPAGGGASSSEPGRAGAQEEAESAR